LIAEFDRWSRACEANLVEASLEHGKDKAKSRQFVAHVARHDAHVKGGMCARRQHLREPAHVLLVIGVEV
jgi:hypothetical protein